jgi:hypothetical protein
MPAALICCLNCSVFRRSRCIIATSCSCKMYVIKYPPHKSSYSFEHAYRIYAVVDYNRLLTSVLKHTVTRQWLLPSIVWMLLCFMLWIKSVPRASIRKANTILRSLPLEYTVHVRSITSIEGLERKTPTIFIVSFRNILNFAKLPSNSTGLSDWSPLVIV